MSKIINWIIKKIKSGYPKYFCSITDVITMFFWNVVLIFMIFYFYEPYTKFYTTNVNDGTIYTIQYDYRTKNTIKEYMIFEFNFNKLSQVHTIHCSGFNELTKTICSKQNQGKKFIGYNIKISLNNYGDSFLLGGKFVEYNCFDCNLIDIGDLTKKVNNRIFRMKIIYYFLILLELCSVIYLIFQIKFRFFNKQP